MRTKDEIIRQLRSIKAGKIINDNEYIPTDECEGGMTIECQEDIRQSLEEWENCLKWVLGLSDVPVEQQRTDKELSGWGVKEIECPDITSLKTVEPAHTGIE